MPKFTTLRRGGSVFYSSNDNLKIDNPYLRHTAAIFKKFGDITVLKIFAAIYKLTKHAEDAYSDILEIAEQSGVSIEKVETVVENELYEYLREKTEAGRTVWRIKGCHMHLIPLMAMFGEHD